MASDRDDYSGARPGRAKGVLTAARIFDFLIILTGAVAVAIAAAGWTILEPPRHWADHVDIAVRSVKALFLSDIYFPTGEAPPNLAEVLPLLELARNLGTLVAVMAAGRIVLTLAAARLIETRIWLTRGHDVAVGCGPAAREYAFSGAGPLVVHVGDADEATSNRRQVELVRSGPLARQFKTANVRGARRLVIDEGEDSETWQTAQLAARICPKVQVVAHISDQWLVERLSRAEPSSRLYAFSYAGGVARQVMLAHPPYLLARAMGAPAQHIVLVGFGDVSQALLREFLVTSVVPEPGPMMVTVIDRQADTLARQFAGRHPGLGAFVDMAFLAGDLLSEDVALEDQIRARVALAEPCAAYVAMAEGEGSSLGVGVGVRDRAARLGLFRCPIFICADHGAGLQPVRHGSGDLGLPILNRKERQKALADAQTHSRLAELRLVTFGSWRDALGGAGLLEDRLDGCARQFHEAYAAESLRNGGGGQPSWDELSDEFRVSNRRAAAHIRAKTFAAGYDLNGWLAEGDGRRQPNELPPAAGAFDPASPGFVARMAELEHRRWTLDRLLNGWRHGAERDEIARLHPMLVPFGELINVEVAKDATVVEVTRTILGAGKGRKAGGRL